MSNFEISRTDQVLINELTDTAELLLNNHNKKPSAWEPSD